MLTKAYWVAVAERAVKTAAQVTVAGLFLSKTGPVNAFELDFKLALGFAAGGALLSVLTSIGSTQVGGTGPSLGAEKLS